MLIKFIVRAVYARPRRFDLTSETDFVGMIADTEAEAIRLADVCAIDTQRGTCVEVDVTKMVQTSNRADTLGSSTMLRHPELALGWARTVVFCRRREAFTSVNGTHTYSWRVGEWTAATPDQLLIQSA